MATRSVSGVPESVTKDLKLKGFKIHALPERADLSAANGRHAVVQGRRDFYKMGLVTGDMTLYYGDRLLEIKGTVLFFVNPNIPHSVVRHSKKRKGYACLFTEAFISSRERREILQNSPLFRSDGTPVIPLDKEQVAFMTGLFQKMLSVYSSNYRHKDELLKNCLALIIHEALRIQPPQNGPQHKNAATRIAWSFMELLERQFPIDNTEQPLRLRTAQDFAGSLSVHPNYLNRSVKDVTGKPTSVHIAERIALEAKALLLYTDWSVADIAQGLGFEYPTYFNNYFKRVTGVTPQSLRKQKV
ncbi:AraC-type DNA-binding protein [Chryseolinea serpens]|uniref:AraC-type DNA-binding protein n=1 Tax=Chryseolinea serpens TaxID=947013 RepID=A0A1M5MCP2_9BACT|nr:helix-turn-helix domain-containing protein [Chryseolinea serpens]SHG75080.1 AraC-type DNA-binding protein [Chryseolinea serpens]